MQTILIAGGSGFIGRNLQSVLSRNGHKTFLIGRNKVGENYSWDEIINNGLPKCDSIISLSGANVLDTRWTEERKKELYDSRIGTNRILFQKLKESDLKLKNFIFSSAVGVYPFSINSKDIYDENSVLPPIDDYLPFPQKLCRDWENDVRAQKAEFEKEGLTHLSNCKMNILRIGLVADKSGGFLKEMLLPFSLCLGGRMGSGQQAFPWIHLADCVGIIEQLLSDNNKTKEGTIEVLNLVSPGIVNNETFSKELGVAMNRPAFMPTPSFVISMLFQDRAQLLLEGTWVRPLNISKILPNYEYQFPELQSALKDIFKV